LGEACFAAAVEDIVKFCAAFAVEYSGQGLCWWVLAVVRAHGRALGPSVVRTFLCRIRLYKTVSRTCLLEFWCKPCQLGQVFVDDTYLRSEAVVVDVLGKVSSGVA
jgi:hypothetical protein